MQKITKVLIVFYFLSVAVVITPAPVNARPETMPPTPPTPATGLRSDISDEIKTAIQEAISTGARGIPVNLIFDTRIEGITISNDGQYAIAWLVPVDRQTKQVIATEPGLAIVRYTGVSWQAILPNNPNWISTIPYVPTDLLSEAQKSSWLEMNTAVGALQLVTYSGYKLPFYGGQTLAMTQSVAHDKYTPSGNAHYAFDFATPGTAQMFNIHASKAGTVKYVKDSCTNGDPNCTNWIVLEDNSTSPTTYQLYMHLAQNSIPTEIRTIGTHVRQGQFIGVADDTGVSTAHHLHFMVHTNPASYWGTSVDITFSDVSINGGRPRITADLPYCRNDSTYQDVCLQFSSTYVSGNYPDNSDTISPYGDILAPLNGASIETNNVYLEGWAKDDQSGLASAQFIARYTGAWHDIGTPFSTLYFSQNWDLCTSNVPDGPVDIALRIQDKAGNLASGLPGLRHILKNYTCPPAPDACSPNDNQVALYQHADYQGTCQVFSSGNYSSTVNFGAIGDNQTSSLKVGNNVLATLYFNSDYRVRGETFTSNDSNLIDNLIGSSTTSSLLVRSRTTSPSVPRLIWPENGNSFPANSSLSLLWDNGGSSNEYQAKLFKNGAEQMTTSWQKLPFIPLGSLAPGSYSWQVKARSNTTESVWSGSNTFTIQESSQTPPSPLTPPFNDNFEGTTSNWIRSPYWDTTTSKNHTPGGSISWFYDINDKPENGYDTGKPNSGDLTSAPITLPVQGIYYLRFWYFYETEANKKFWDQRKVQISVNGQPFIDLLQLIDDPARYWLQSPAISLAEYQGATIQIRFHFETMDKYLNKYQGWYIDDFSINLTAPPECSDGYEPNNSIAQAFPASYGQTLSGSICPGGDGDYYRFSGSAGDRIGVIVKGNASLAGSLLDPYLTLLDANGNVLAENDDQVLAQVTDSQITYTLPNSSDYYLFVRAWDHPSAGSQDHFYTLSLYRDSSDPNASFIYPTTGSIIPKSVITLSVNASDGQSGISHVAFFWHSSDWLSDEWLPIGDDWNPMDGWSIQYDMSSTPIQDGMAFYARTYDYAGNEHSTAAWNLRNVNTLFYFPIIRR